MTISGIDHLELRRHAPVGRPRRNIAVGHSRGLAHLYAARNRSRLPDLFVTDQAEARRGGGFRWFFSTCLAAAVGAIAIGAVIFGSLDLSGSPGRIAASIQNVTRPVSSSLGRQRSAALGGLSWNIPKSDRLQATIDSVSTRYVVQASIKERRSDREYLHNKPYARVAIRLAAVQPSPNVSIPAFNPLKLFANTDSAGKSSGAAEASAGPEGGEVTLRIVELLGSILPAEDGQELDTREAADLVLRNLASGPNAVSIRPSFAPEGLEVAAGASATASLAPNTSILPKTAVDPDDVSDEAEGEHVRVKVGRGESLSQLLVRMGSEAFQAREMVDTARNIFPESAVQPGFEVELTLVPSLSGSGKTEPARYSVFDARGDHKVTVERNAAGEFVASATSSQPKAQGTTTATLYASLYTGALAQGIAPDTIETILRLHAYEADFRRRARGSDTAELFFDLKDEDKGADGALGELLLSSITVSGATSQFYRFKSADGTIDYYDGNGNNSRRFLLRKPVRSDDVRLTSGFGVRFHPLLNQRKLHSGIDWAGPSGTPIVAAGNGTIEEAGYKGQYGNYIRIRHANGYQTAYGHMRGFAKGSKVGAKVRQGEVIGFLGSTGLSSGPHVHFEVLVSSRFVDPLSIQVPREKRLAGEQLAAFQRERARVDDLMRRPPVRVRTIASQN